MKGKWNLFNLKKNYLFCERHRVAQPFSLKRLRNASTQAAFAWKPPKPFPGWTSRQGTECLKAVRWVVWSEPATCHLWTPCLCKASLILTSRFIKKLLAHIQNNKFSEPCYHVCSLHKGENGRTDGESDGMAYMPPLLIMLSALPHRGSHPCHLEMVWFSMKGACKPCFNRWLLPFWIWLSLCKTALAAFKVTFYTIKFILKNSLITKCITLGEKRAFEIFKKIAGMCSLEVIKRNVSP